MMIQPTDDNMIIVGLKRTAQLKYDSMGGFGKVAPFI